MQYEVIMHGIQNSEDKKKFMVIINKKLVEGWELQGGVSISSELKSGVIVMAQALIRFVK